MKKVFIVASMSLFVLASCKKDYTCECKVSSSGVSLPTTSTTINDTKKNAEEACNKTTTTAGITSTCAIK